MRLMRGLMLIVEIASRRAPSGALRSAPRPGEPAQPAAPVTRGPGLRTAVLWVVLCALMAAALWSCAPTGNVGARDLALRREARSGRVALVVGNAGYHHFGQLANPLRDARGLHTTLEGMGFRVVLVEDASIDRLRGAVRRFAQEVAPGDVAVIYYSGHGVSVGGHNYLVPIDFNATCDTSLGAALEERAVSVDELLSSIAGRRSRNIVLFDACRNNPCATSARSATRAGAAARSVGSGLAAVRAPRDTIVVYATDPNNTADDAPGAETARSQPR